MIPGARGMNPRMLQQMMKQLGISVEELDGVERVVIETAAKDYVFTRPAVSAMKSQGQTTWQVQGEPQVFPKGHAPGVKEGVVKRHPADTGAGVVVSPKPGAPGASGTPSALAAPAAPSAPAAPAEPAPLYTEDDVKMVMEAAHVSREKAKQALDDAEGEVATAIMGLTGG